MLFKVKIFLHFVGLTKYYLHHSMKIFNTLAPDDGLYTFEVDGKNETLLLSTMYELPLLSLKLKLSMSMSSGANVSIIYKQY